MARTNTRNTRQHTPAPTDDNHGLNHEGAQPSGRPAPDPQSSTTPAFVTQDAFEQFKAQMLQAMKDLLPQTPPEGKGKAKAVSQGHNENASLD